VKKKKVKRGTRGKRKVTTIAVHRGRGRGVRFARDTGVMAESRVGAEGTRGKIQQERAKRVGAPEGGYGPCG